ncbi:hypothetical protein [Mycolicibacterium fortuitum]|uniref:Uncharacterized protein n=2 Tax=Mycolicibacterium fortuitum TaxID=1766 RepID=A0AAE4VHM1_MYCFO|nr:hypothetical protein [Mycolicibacterium fortuitum]MCV7137922.1 hypothetical protein [Mycolicibacterium fortuitum]MDV7194487.1 hypothetical protein [Mycolicibacterium fortuitum]MDV7207883.1 hypothetical protein [Mycolicibacterium fortuitum]MDV7229181.1 hypothetical protein [Mycolicibacterium fortuitum]MDV7260880.1 hypothetical protein [Mycolicibacterium fortuitum]
MADRHSIQIQEACDDLYCAPLDPVAQANARDLLARLTPVEDERATRRRIRIACDELHDDPNDIDARRALLALLDSISTASRPNVGART